VGPLLSVQDGMLFQDSTTALPSRTGSLGAWANDDDHGVSDEAVSGWIGCDHGVG